VSVQKNTIQLVRECAEKKLLFLPHAIQQMSRPDRMISPSDVHRVIHNGELIEDYPEDARGHSCLILGYGDGERAIHVICSPKEDYLAIITAYLPDREQWEDNLRKRKNK